jgi:hypothetical protein
MQQFMLSARPPVPAHAKKCAPARWETLRSKFADESVPFARQAPACKYKPSTALVNSCFFVGMYVSN